MLARSQNALRGRWENFWSSEQVCVVRLVNREDVIAKLVYTATNPVKDGLVDRVYSTDFMRC
jgi:biotin-(acetyl-CoA carboxylase) ligase